MITTVTLNAAIDKTYFVDGWQPGGVYRVQRTLSEPGGKGNNVAKVIKSLGGHVTATGFAGGANGAFIEQSLQHYGIESRFVGIEQESRICLNIIDGSSNRSTEFLEPGPTIGIEQWNEFKDVLHGLARQSAVVVFSGSLPSGLPVSAYYDLVTSAKSAGALTVLDSSGEALRRGLQALPDCIKPNEHELLQLNGDSRLDERGLVDSLSRLAKQGIPHICVSLGDKGALAYMANELFRVVPPKIEAVNTVGCGDAFVAGIAYGLEQGCPPSECLRMAAAAAAANALSEQAGKVEPQLYRQLLDQVRVEPYLPY